jgi:hypothetical protein
MKTSDLESVLDAQNQIILKKCFKTWTSKETNSASGSDYPVGKRMSLHAGHPCCGGMVKKLPFPCKNLEKHIILGPIGPAAAVGSVAVGWILHANGAAPGANLDVVVAVGINYSQGAGFLLNPVPRTSATGMTRRLSGANAAIVANPVPGCIIQSLPGKFHLVVGNFFPWITSLAWSQYGFNAIEEALLLHCFGYPDPLDPLRQLLAKLGGAVTHIAFHGAKNAVPLLGTQFVTGHQPLLRAVQVLFCDNLARPGLPVRNAVGLCL